MIQKRVWLGMLCLVLCGSLVGSATAQSGGPEAPEAAVTTAFTYQGQLDRNGTPYTGTCDMQFKLWDSAANGAQQGSTLTEPDVDVADGIFAVELQFGSVNYFTGQARWLEPGFKCADDAGFTALPRVALTATPYAIGLMPGAVINGSIPYGGGSATLRVYNTSASDGTAVIGQANAVSGATAGLTGLASSPTGAGVRGRNDTGTGVLGQSVSNIGVIGTSSSWVGVYGQSSSAFGVWGKSTTGAGVVGESTDWVGVYGESDVQAGVWGDSTSGYGVYGESDDQDGIHGLSYGINKAGVAGINNVSSGIGVYGSAPNGLAARFDGQTRIQAPLGTLPLIVKQDALESQTPGLATFETNSGTIGSLGADSGIFIVGAATSKALGLNVNGSTRAVTIASNGSVGIGTNIIPARLVVRGTGNTGSTVGLRVENASGSNTFHVNDDGSVVVGSLPDVGSTHGVCGSNIATGWFLSSCSSAAEYVPTIDGGYGFPEAADVVSIAPEAANPYGDSHGPFVVTKSPQPCDPNLLGFIVNPASGADGKKLNEHYLPLAIYGYFPAKVTTENGAIQRGDALTSSSKPGHAMKATQACKIIGYALEGADQDGTIQVFANFGESVGTETAALRAEVEELSRTVAELKQQNAAQDTTPRDVLLMGAVLVAGLVIGRRQERGGSK